MKLKTAAQVLKKQEEGQEKRQMPGGNNSNNKESTNQKMVNHFLQHLRVYQGRGQGAGAALVAVEYTGCRLEYCATADDIEGYIN